MGLFCSAVIFVNSSRLNRTMDNSVLLSGCRRFPSARQNTDNPKVSSLSQILLTKVNLLT